MQDRKQRSLRDVKYNPTNFKIVVEVSTFFKTPELGESVQFKKEDLVLLAKHIGIYFLERKPQLEKEKAII